MRTARVFGFGLSCVFLLTQCSAGSDGPPDSTVKPQGGDDSAGGTDPGAGTGNKPSGGGTISLGGTGNTTAGTGGRGGSDVDTSGCGDGVLQATALGETCDDGNSQSGDGCSADCKVVEQNYSCLEPGTPCESTVMCGDGNVAGTETCDDGSATASDGCDATCMLETGWLCPSPGDPCVAERCGDGVVEGGEPCDDPNTVVGDGCSPGCQAEPICTKPSDADGCSSSCGDGILLDGDSEECDDGNKRAGDGCSATCLVEDGYECTKEAGTLPASIQIPFVFRDFISFPSATTTLKRHPDFQSRCVSQQQNDMLNGTLDAMGKPVNSGLCNLAATCTLDLGPINQANDHCGSHETCTPNFDGCDQLHGLHPIAGHPGDPFNFWYRTTDGVNKEKVVTTTLTLANGKYSFNSSGLFPFDNAGWVAAGDETTSGSHNWGFTTEVRRWFQFDGAEILTFNGDDDVWVYINGKLALDLGGLHGTEVRSIRLNANGTVDCKQGEPNPQTNVTFADLTDCNVPQRTLGLIVGKVYEIALFHAERHTNASNFRLSLTGFVSVKSKCAAVCGDGTQTPGESCDDGAMNDDTAYGGCTTKCKRGPRCGDGTQQMPQEACDDGMNLTPYSPTQQGCAPGCKLPSFCGDAKLDGLFGEECDDGTNLNAGGYGGCNPDCTLGPRCGDKKIDEPTENCDDGNAVSGDGCSSKCVKEDPK